MKSLFSPDKNEIKDYTEYSKNFIKNYSGVENEVPDGTLFPKRNPVGLKKICNFILKSLANIKDNGKFDVTKLSVNKAVRYCDQYSESELLMLEGYIHFWKLVVPEIKNTFTTNERNGFSIFMTSMNRGNDLMEPLDYTDEDLDDALISRSYLVRCIYRSGLLLGGYEFAIRNNIRDQYIANGRNILFEDYTGWKTFLDECQSRIKELD